MKIKSVKIGHCEAEKDDEIKVFGMVVEFDEPVVLLAGQSLKEAGNVAVTDYLLRALAQFGAGSDIAPPVSAGSVDIDDNSFRELYERFNAIPGNGDDARRAWSALVEHVNAWGAQQREQGKVEQTAFLKECLRRDTAEFNRKWLEQHQRAEKAEAELAEAQRWLDMYSICMKTAGVDALYSRPNAAEARVKVLEEELRLKKLPGDWL